MNRRTDAIVVLALVATAFVIGWPIVAGGWLTYFDNPAHLAEIHSLAAEGSGGWSSIGFAGLSLDTLHSPVLWRALAALPDGALGPMYGVLVCLSLAAPAVALYAVARRRTSWPWAAALAYLLLIQHPAIVGSAAVTAGMWTFYLAAAAWIVLADRLARAETGVALIAGLLGFIGLVHLYVLEAAVALVVVHTLWSRRTIRRDALACALGVAASAVYWLPVALGAPAFDHPQNLGPSVLAELLVLPTDTIELLAPGSGVASALPAFVESIPMLALLVAGALGAARLRRGRDVLPAYGAIVAGLVLLVLLVARPLELRALGPNSWRFLYFVRVGAALAAIPLVRRERLPVAPLAVAAIASGWLWGAPLRADVPSVDGAEMGDVRALWTWLAAHRDGTRVYLQDTFGAPPGELARSHVLALTLHETGVEPLGPFYGIVPATTARALSSELGLLFGGSPVPPLGEWGATALVTATPAALQGSIPVVRIGRFTVWRQSIPSALLPAGTRDGTRRIVVELDHDSTLAIAWHPFWRLVSESARLGADAQGRMTISGLSPGHHRLELAYQPPLVWPASVAGWLAIVTLPILRRLRGRRGRASEADSAETGS